MHALPMAVASLHSSSGFSRWLLVILLLLLVVSFVINAVQGHRISRLRAERAGPEEDYEFPGWGDGKDAHEALTDPDLQLLPEPSHGGSVVFPRGKRPKPVAAAVPGYVPEPEPVADTVVFGKIVDEGDWAQEASVPAPPIQANPVHHQQAMAWIEQWEAEDKARQLALAGPA